MRRLLIILAVLAGALLPSIVTAQQAEPSLDDLRSLAALLRKPVIAPWRPQPVASP